MHRQNYNSGSHDRYLAHNEQSTLHRMKETYYTTKQAVIKKLGKKEDKHVVASDAQLDSKLEVFKAIQKSSMDLLRAIEKYQDRLCALSQEENAMGRFLKNECAHDKTRAGKMMGAVGKAQSFSSQQRLALRVPLVRLYQEVETFRYRAISDTLLTINRMEQARTEYRGALLWMKDVSEELDPDTYKQLEKFRKVQAQVKKTKAKFDKLKLDTMQKIDLLAASRCNMYSHVLANYQSTLLHFWEKTSRTMSAVAESFKGYQYYEFSMLKELSEPTKQLAEKTGTKDEPERDLDQAVDKDGLIELAASEKSNMDEEDDDKASLSNLLDDIDKEIGAKSDFGPFMDYEDDDGALEKIKSKQDAELELTRRVMGPPGGKDDKLKGLKVPKDLLSDEIEDESEKDDLTLLNEILNAPPSAEDDFSKEWQAVFGSTPLSTNMNLTPVEPDQSNTADFMPSNLLDMTRQINAMALNQGPMPGQSAGGMPGNPMGIPPSMMGAMPPGGQMMQGAMQQQQQQLQQLQQQQQQQNSSKNPAGKKQGEQKGDMSAWFNLFADLDPLSNPDAIGRNDEEMSGAL